MGELEEFCERNGGTLADLDVIIEKIHRADRYAHYQREKEYFHSFQDAIEWSRSSGGKAFIPDGSGYREK